ncbi:cbb3-type cytochrome c oxidase subunit I [Stakelama sp. CBK3Z-3]|uniref:Cbb3-type cytochrome c oxidase subunit I n=1 Tax=Stakelama flava TaxID=2860338 RepID=A0ABS6XQE7_9SPHN|nr:cbb3-type cytochrome c oxidase subunit I [Stakelama flava]MBW4332008.1 cbb3-type cytochrome c oxidase subunit I [Stakelama flava]
MTVQSAWFWAIGRIDLHSFAFVRAWEDPSLDKMIAAGAASLVVLGAIAVFAIITKLRKWRYLWQDWFTSVDHKKIGIMYVILSGIMLTRAVIEAVLMRMQQAVAVNQPGIVAPEHFGELFSTHGSIMIFFMAMPFLTGIINYVMPLQIVARDVAFPTLNSISLGLTVSGAVLLMISLVVGKFSTGGWSGYPPYTEMAFNSGVGPDYWIWAVTLSSIGSTMTGLNFAVTIYKSRAPGMHLFRMPLFCWTALCTSILMIFAMPPLTVATLMLALDRYLDFHLFTTDLGGNMMNYANLFWLFGHPEVYILILPAFGVYSEVISTFSAKRLYAYRTLVYATMVIAVLSFTVWLHHFFTMGQNANINGFFGIATMCVGIPTGVKVYDWILTMYRGRVRFTVPMLYAIAFLVTFVIGGMTGIILATPPLDYVVHNTLFLVAHFHNMLIPGLLYGMLAGYQFWFPKAFGFRLDETWGRISFACWVVGFYLAFMPLYVLGAMGMPRRMAGVFQGEYLPWLIIACIGAFILLAALGALFVQLVISIRRREKTRVPAGDPWDGRSLEWAISSPPPEYNFAVIPCVEDRDPFALRKEQGRAYQPPHAYEDIEMPKNSVLGPVLCIVGAAAGFALVWHIWWLAILSFLGILAAVIVSSFSRDTHRVIPASEVARTHEHWLRTVAEARAIPRELETRSANEGLAESAV